MEAGQCECLWFQSFFVQSTELAFDMTESFRVKTGAQICILELCAVFHAFSLEVLPLLAFFHFELRGMIFVLNWTGSFLATVVFFAAFSVFAFAASFLCVIIACFIQCLCVASCGGLVRVNHWEASWNRFGVKFVEKNILMQISKVHKAVVYVLSVKRFPAVLQK